MKKILQNQVDCANCANKMEEAAKNTAGVKDAAVNFDAENERKFRRGQDRRAL